MERRVAERVGLRVVTQDRGMNIERKGMDWSSSMRKQKKAEKKDTRKEERDIFWQRVWLSE
jgi:hypothetical protein